jgi:hypothetical protein
MPRTAPSAFQLLLLPFILLNAACSQITRGSEINSADGKTYLVVAELDGPACTTVYLDGKPWPHAVGVAGAIEPGEHEIKCAAPIHFIVRPGTVFRFKYWGP